MKRLTLSPSGIPILLGILLLLFFVIPRLRRALWKRESFTSSSSSDPTLKRMTNIDHTSYGNIFVFDEDDVITKSILNGDVWEELYCKKMADHYKSGTDVLDIGANLGLNSMTLHKIKPITGIFHLFEPQPEVFSMMAYNTRNLPRKLYNFPLSSTNEILQFEPVLENYGGTSMTRAGKGVNVHATYLDSLQFPNQVSIVKMDVEGGEEGVLEGGKRFFADHKPTIFLEAWPNVRDNLFAKLESMSYKQLEQIGPNDFVFVPA